MILRFNAFGGIMPALEPAKLPEPNAEDALSCKFQRGNIAPFNVETTYQTPASQAANILSLHRLGSNQWMSFTTEVGVVRGPMPIGSGESFEDDFRLYYAGEGVTFTGRDGGGTPASVQWPGFTTRRKAVNNLPANAWFAPPQIKYPMGVPYPGWASNAAGAPTVTVSAAPTGTVTAVTKTNPAKFTVSVIPSPALTNGARVRFSGFPGTGDGSELNGATYPVTKVSDLQYRIEGFDATDWAADLTGTFTWTRAYDDIEVEDRIYCFTYVDEFGQESKPGTNSEVVAVGDGQSVSVTTPIVTTLERNASPDFNLGGNGKKRIYRSVTGDTFNFLLVAETAITQAVFVDNVGDAVLGEAQPTGGYDLPPQRLHSLVNHPNGFLAGAVDNEAHFSEPYAVYAWPIKYRKVLANRIVGVGVYGSTIVYATEANPVLAYASDPMSISWRTLDVVHPCISRHTVVSNGGAVFYVSPAGLVQCDDAGARVITYPYWNEEQWRALVTSVFGWALPMSAVWLDDSYWLTINYSNLWRIQFKGNGILNVVRVLPNRSITSGNADYGVLCSDHETGELFGMRYSAGNPSARVLERIDDRASSTQVPFTWTSRTVTLPHETNFGAMQVFCPESGSWAYTVTCTPDSASGKTPFDITVQNNRPVRLPAGYLTGTWKFSIKGTKEVSAVHFATSISELRRVAL
ncbi:MAG: hypothetical protein KAX77_05040 [Xanthomonadales bacterium]|nr:hypothetical protein [Xanthomonadales bacterium]